MNWWHAVILGLVEGVTEYLPVSSTGHLILASAFLGLDDPGAKSAIDAFLIVVQGGAILAVLGLCRHRVSQMIRGVLGRDPAGRRLFFHIVIAFLPAAILGFLLADFIETRLFHPIPVLAALILGGVWMIWLDRTKARLWRPLRNDSSPSKEESAAKVTTAPPRTIGLDDLTWKTALLIGCFQVLSMWPGTSRSMMTIAGGVMLGIPPKKAAEFSFLLGLPTLGGATLYKLAKNIKESRDTGDPDMIATLGVAPTLLGILVATLSAGLAVTWLVSFLNRHGLAPFGWYRIALGVGMSALIAAGVVRL